MDPYDSNPDIINQHATSQVSPTTLIKETCFGRKTKVPFYLRDYDTS
jgi:hypothetical protein